MYSMICNITISLAVNPGRLICIHQCKTENGIYSEEEISPVK